MDELISDNRDIRAAWHYHQGTKHPDGRLMNRWHSYDPADSPRPFKIYKNLEPIPLPLDTQPLGLPALSAIAANARSEGQERVPDIGILARLLYFSAGITKRLTYPGWGEILFRAAACTGALYHIELYVICGDLPGLAAGVYHFDPQGFALTRLRQGDYRDVLVAATGGELTVAHAPLIIAYSDVFWRNAVKYQAREYRHAFWDSGTILAHTLAVAAAHDLPARIIAGFVDQAVDNLLGLNTEDEAALALVPVGHTPEATAMATAAPAPLSLETVPDSDYRLDFPAIHEMHAASSLVDEAEAAAWRSPSPQRVTPPPAGELVPLRPYDSHEMSPDLLEDVIKRRGSARRFTQKVISFRELSTILSQSLRGVPADFLDPPGAALSDLYLIANAVDGLASGAYVLRREEAALERLKSGDFRGDAGHLALGQALAADASVALFFLADLEPILERFGNRGYRAAQLEASVAAGRIYLAAYAQGLGATGLTFYDDAVTAFFSPHAQGKSVMFLIALGKPAAKRSIR